MKKNATRIRKMFYGFLNGIGEMVTAYFEPQEERYENGAGTIMDCMWKTGTKVKQ